MLLDSLSDRAVIDCCIWAFKFTMMTLIFFLLCIFFLSFVVLLAQKVKVEIPV